MILRLSFTAHTDYHTISTNIRDLKCINFVTVNKCKKNTHVTFTTGSNLHNEKTNTVSMHKIIAFSEATQNARHKKYILKIIKYP